MNTTSDHVESKLHSDCYRCPNGCVHIVCGNTTLTLAPRDFLVLADAIDSLRDTLREETQEDGATVTNADFAVM
jgi:GH24 family phage-related lysozyme (muramidase)